MGPLPQIKKIRASDSLKRPPFWLIFPPTKDKGDWATSLSPRQWVFSGIGFASMRALFRMSSGYWLLNLCWCFNKHKLLFLTVDISLHSVGDGLSCSMHWGLALLLENNIVYKTELHTLIKKPWLLSHESQELPQWFHTYHKILGRALSQVLTHTLN